MESKLKQSISHCESCNYMSIADCSCHLNSYRRYPGARRFGDRAAHFRNWIVLGTPALSVIQACTRYDPGKVHER